MLIVINGKLAGCKLAGLGDAAIGQGRAGMANGRADAGQQLGGAEGLDQVIIGAVVQSLHLIMLMVPGGNHHHRKIGPLAHGLEDLHAVHIRQPQVQHDQIRTVGGDHGQGLLAGAHNDGVEIAGLQNHGDEIADALLIFYNEHLVLNFHVFPPFP